MTTKLHYVWLDAAGKLRSKLKITEKQINTLEQCPDWSFDGSSTEQATGDNSDCILKPARLYKQTAIYGGISDVVGVPKIVLCEVFDSEDKPHESNHRRQLFKDMVETEGSETIWAAFENEFTFMQDGLPLGFNALAEQGPYYCGLGSNHVQGRDCIMKAIEEMEKYGLTITGHNVEVLTGGGQHEYQLFSDYALKLCDDDIVSKFLLHLTTEGYDYYASFDTIPVAGPFNKNGKHLNFSTAEMREDYAAVEQFCKDFGPVYHKYKHLTGDDNKARLSGDYETADYDVYSYGIADRGATIRIPPSMDYVEWRSPAASADPYEIMSVMLKAVN